MKKPLRMLLVEDSENDAQLILRELERGGYEVSSRRVETPEDMAAALREQPWDIVVSDFSLPSFGAIAALRLFRESGIDVPFIVVSGTIGEESAVEALKAGAHDFLVKGRFARLVPAIERELREVRFRSERRSGLRAQALLAAIVSSSTDAVFSATLDGVVTSWNRGAEKLYGYPAEEMVGKPASLLFPQPQHEQAELLLARARAGEAMEPFETVRRRKDGSLVEVSLTLSPVFDDRGAVVATAAIARDITQRKRMQEQLLISDRMVSIGMLAAGVAHEINNPLSSVMANLDYSLRDIDQFEAKPGGPITIEEMQEALADAREAAERVRTIVRDLKLFSRSEEEKRGPVDIRRVIESSLRMAWNEIRHRARLVKDYTDVPPVAGSESRLGQVFLNLVVNAAQSIHEGNADQNEIRVSTHLDPSGRVRVEVRDTGSGMVPEVLERLFTPFFTTKPRGVGTGLGLAITQRIVTNLGGEIFVESTPNVGTVFKVFLPVAAADQPEAARPDKQPAAGSARRGRVMVVDDEVMVGAAIRRALASEHDVVALTDAREALGRITGGQTFDVIFCDLMMPEMTGMDFHEALQKSAPDQLERVIFMSGGAFSHRARQFLAEVRNLRVEKPFDIGNIRTLVRERVR
jgi:PAS domain S-box-containing protein